MAFNPACDIPELSNKAFLITGGTNGLGKQTIITLAKHSPKHIYFTAPSVKLTFIECDPLSLSSVEKAAKDFLSQTSQLDILICNAGVIATDATLTKEGYENQFGVNHVAHALLVKLLLPTIEKTAEKTEDIRILFLTSLGFMYHFPGGVQFDGLKTTQDFGPGLAVGSLWPEQARQRAIFGGASTSVPIRHVHFLAPGGGQHRDHRPFDA